MIISCWLLGVVILFVVMDFPWWKGTIIQGLFKSFNVNFYDIVGTKIMLAMAITAISPHR
jgi:hypothetical protein